jgi:precorrin-6B methylase 2
MRFPKVTMPLTLALVLSAVIATAVAQTTTAPKPLDVPYVPTDEKVVAQMLSVAKVGKKDVLYDLGSGDGRIVITAAKKFGTRGVGIDIDPDRIKEANDNAREAGVTNLVKFIQGDIFDADIKEATVVTMYLLPAINMKLRPKLLSDLKPGTRIVSHNYDLGDWKPEKKLTVTVGSTEHLVYFWKVPARAAQDR